MLTLSTLYIKMQELARLRGGSMNNGVQRSEAAELDRLAERINEEHRQCEAAFTNGLQHAIRAGELLEEVKGTLEHGSWLPWLKENFTGSVRTAQAYMRVARRRGDFDTLGGFDNQGNAQRAARLSLRDTLSALAEPTAKEIAEDTRREVKQETRTVEGPRIISSERQAAVEAVAAANETGAMRLLLPTLATLSPLPLY
jgi:Protein of unknown function (DUF3102)